MHACKDPQMWKLRSQETKVCVESPFNRCKSIWKASNRKSQESKRESAEIKLKKSRNVKWKNEKIWIEYVI